MSTDTLDKDAEIKRLREELAEAKSELKERNKTVVKLVNTVHELQEKAGPTANNRLLARRVAEVGIDKNASPRLQADTDLAALMHQFDTARLMYLESRDAHDRTKASLAYYMDRSRLLSRSLAEAREELVIAQQQLALDKCALELAGL
jgi:hypothetical protein